jgi:hypothetical protein
VRWKKEEGRRWAKRITSVGVRRTCGVARQQPSKGASAACGGEEGESRRETGMAAAARAAWGVIGGHSTALRIVRQSRSRSTQLQRLQDRSAEALETGGGRVRWKKEKGGRLAKRISSVGVCGPAGSLGGSPSKGRRPRAVARKEKVGAKLGWRQRRARLGARSVVTRRRSGSCGSRAQGSLSFSGSKIARRQLSK